jgi:hypothetical protein
MSGDVEHLDVGCFLASPRHAFHFETSEAAQAKILSRVDELERTGRVAGKMPIVNIQSAPSLVELHDGNASVVAWFRWASMRRMAPSLGLLRRSFDEVVVLHDRRHASGEVWHPFVPIEVHSADRLEAVVDAEQGREARKALSLEGDPVFFDDDYYFAGKDRAEAIRVIAERLGARG